VPGSIRKRDDRGKNVYELRVFLGRDDYGRVRHKSTVFPGPLRAAETELARLVTEQAAEPDPVPIETAFGPTTTINMAILAWKENGWQDLSPSTTRRYDFTERLVAAALANNRGFFSSTGGIDAERVAFLELALDRLPPDHPTRALVLATLCAELAYGSTLDHRQALADEALVIAERTGDDAARVRVLNLVSYPLSMPSLLQQSLASTTDALVRAERLGDPVLTFLAAGWRTEVAARAGDMEEMDRCMQRAGALADQLDQPSLHWLHTYRRATRALIAGDADRAEQLATEALQFGNDSGQPDAMMLFRGQLMFVHMQRGTLQMTGPRRPPAAVTARPSWC